MLCSHRVGWGGGRVGPCKAQTMKESERPRGEGDRINFIDFRFERG